MEFRPALLPVGVLQQGSVTKLHLIGANGRICGAIPAGRLLLFIGRTSELVRK